MPVDQASYRPWDGTARPGKGVILAIAGTLIRRLLRIRVVVWLSSAMLIFALVGSAIALYGRHLMGESPETVALLARFGVKDLNLFAWVNLMFHRSIGFWALLMAALTGAPLIAEDRRAKALPLYFSRPVSHFDYVLGKLATVAFFLGLLLLVPPIGMFLVELALSSKEGVFLDQLPVLGKSLLAGLALLLPLGAISLGLSSLSDRPGHAALMTLGIMVTKPLSMLFSREVFRDSSWHALFPPSCSRRIAAHYLAEMRSEGPGSFADMDVGDAWLGVAAWTVLGLALLLWRIRKVEVVQ